MSLSMRSDVETIDSSSAAPIVFEKTINQYFQVATVTLLVYDAAILFGKEVKYYWRIPRSTTDFAYFSIRYIQIFGSIVDLFCKFTTWTTNIANWMTIVLIDYILMIRVLALYSQDRTLSICLKALLVLEAAFKMGLLSYVIREENVAVGQLGENATICITESSVLWQLGVVDWLVPMVYAVVLMILAIYKATEYWKISTGFKGFALVRVLVQDQMIYFMSAIACSLLNILTFRISISNDILASILNAVGNPPLLCIFGARMLINLKEAAERGQNEGTNIKISSRTMSQIDFAEPGTLPRSCFAILCFMRY
ncbi:hypothetical protein ACEPAH_8558 [Sanghuangporus vaninii]